MAGLGLIGTAIAGGMAGGGAGIARGAEMMGEYLSRSQLQAEQAAIQELRDKRIAARYSVLEHSSVILRITCMNSESFIGQPSF